MATNTTESEPKESHRNICLVCPPAQSPRRECGQASIVRLAAILAPLAAQLFILTGNFPNPVSHKNAAVINVRTPVIEPEGFFVYKVIAVVLAQFTISIELIKLRRKVDTVVFLFINTLLLPPLVARILGMKTVVRVTGSQSKAQRDIRRFPLNHIIFGVLRCIEHVGYLLANRIIVFGGDVAEWGVPKHSDKVVGARSYYLDLNAFSPKQEFGERSRVVGYVGRLSEEKGIMDLVKAIPMVLNGDRDIQFMIIGDGPLRSEIAAYLGANSLTDNVRLLGWIPNNELPEYISQMKLLVAPSRTEVFPGTAIEAMACHTPVLVAPVGATVDIVNDERNGFVLSGASPDKIAHDILRALRHPDLYLIAQKARDMVEREYTHEAAVGRYRTILSEL